MARLRLALAALLLACACRPNTTRPAITPYPEAAGVEIRLRPQEATRRLAEALQAESLPPARVRLRDGYIETAWLDSATGRPTSRRPLGTDVVRLRAWADPGRPGNTVLTVETLYRPFADPSLPERELERPVAPTHPTAMKVERILQALLERHGGPPPPAPEQPAGPREGMPPVPGDEGEVPVEEGEEAAGTTLADTSHTTYDFTQSSSLPRSSSASLQGPDGSVMVSPSTGTLPATSCNPLTMSRSQATATTALGRRSRITRRASCPRVATNTGTP